LRRYTDVVRSSVREVAWFNVLGAVVALGALLVIQIPLSDSFGFVILIESTGLMLIGGAMGVAGQATTRRVAEWATRRKLRDSEVTTSDLAAALYALTGCMLFAEAFVLSVFLS
jgi:hypothetical protein